ncbi:MAG TPA: DUF1326 domain-containing protein [Candidatus Sulfotelmatobacter sp.]|nr:DUF1326 domain-containing protein [Candidatus Sulfotelmatobacter sp.]
MPYRSKLFTVSLCLVALALILLLASKVSSSSTKNDFEITATYIEACSCDMFCPCYFNTHSTAHEHAHFCRANLVFRVDKGHYKDVKLDGAKVWLSNDLGSDWSTGKDSWAVVTYDTGVTPPQKAALDDIVAQLYPFKWTWLKTDTAAFSWEIDTKKGTATAKRDDGKGEVVLERVKGDNPDEEVVMKNLRYWNAQSNDGFRMWKSKHEMYEGHEQKFDYTGTNGFLITIHFTGTAK